VLTTLFSLPTTMALDVNDEGRLLVLYDGTGTRQVNEIAPTEAGELSPTSTTPAATPSSFPAPGR